jgi:superfamily II DNA helicase RecQ
MVHRHFIEEGAAWEQPGRLGRLNTLLRFAEARECRWRRLLDYFGEPLPHPCRNCDNCVRPPPCGKTTDATEPARQFLSCVKLTGQVFGPAHIIAVLRGSGAAKVMARHHDRLVTFGVGRQHSVEEWRELAHQFTRVGLLEVDPEFGSLHLTPKGWDVLGGKEKVFVPLTPALSASAPNSIIRPFLRRRFQEIGELFAGGKSLEELAQHYQVTTQTVVENLQRFVENGGQVAPERVLALSRLPETELARVLSAFESLGLERLAPVHEALAGAVNYNELHLLRLYMLCRKQQPPLS